MRIILLLVFYVAIYVARIAAGGIATTMSGNSMKYILEHKTTRNEISGALIDDETTQKTIKRSKQSLLVNRIDEFLQNRRVLNGKLTRVRRSPRKRTKYAKDSDGEIMRLDFENDDDTDDRDDATSDAKGLRGLPIWQIPEPTAPIVNTNSTTNPTITRIGTINRSPLMFATLPSHLANLDSKGMLESDEAIYATRANLQGIFNELPEGFVESESAIDDNHRKYRPKAVVLSKIPVYILSYPNKYNINAPDKKIIFSKIPDPKFARPQQFQWQFDGYQKDSPKLHNKEQLRNNHLTRKKFLLIPISKDLYMLKDIDDRNSRLNTDKNNATLAILSFKAHMHHDVNDVGKAYFRSDPNNHRMFEYNATDLYSKADLNFDIFEENVHSTEDSMPLNSLYPDITFRTYSDLIDTAPEISDGQIVLRIPDRMNISRTSIDLDDRVNSYDSTASLSTSSSFDEFRYDAHSEENVGQQNISSEIKLDKIDPFRLNDGNYEKSAEYMDPAAESTTTDVRSLFDTFDGHIDVSSVTSEDVGIYLNDNEVLDISQSIKDDPKLSARYDNQDVDEQNIMDYVSMQYMLTSDMAITKDYTTFSDATYAFTDDGDNILNNQNVDIAHKKSTNVANEESIISNSFHYEKPTDRNSFNYNSKFIDGMLSDYTTAVNSFVSSVDYTTSASLFPSTDELSLKKEESTVGNSGNLLMAIKPLSSELEKLLNAVKLVNKSISNVQNRLCDKKNVARLTRTERAGKERRAVKHVLSREDLDRQFRKKKRIKTRNRNAVDRTSDFDTKLKKKNNDYLLLLNKLTTPLRKRANSANSARVQGDNRNFLEKQGVSERRFSKSGDFERHRSPHSRLNRSLKSLTGNYDARIKSTKMARSTTPVIKLSHLITSNISSKNNFLNNRIRNSQRYNNRLDFLSNNTAFLDTFANRHSRKYFLSSNKRDLRQRDTQRTISNETSASDKEKKLRGVSSPVDPQFYTEATAYLDILRLLNRTAKPYVERNLTDVDWILKNVTNLIASTTEFSAITTTFSPYLVEKSTTVVSSTTLLEKEELPKMTEVLYEDETGTPYFEYYKYDEDYDKQNYTGVYGDYEYEENVTSWYDYTEKTTTEMEKVSATIITDLVPEFTFKETTSIGIKKMDYGIETTTFADTIMEYTTTEYSFITSSILITTTVITTEILETIPVTEFMLDVSIMTTPTISLPFYTTQLSIPAIDETTTAITEIITDEIITLLTEGISPKGTESTIAIPRMETFTTESMIVLTPLLEGMTDITLKITIPVSTETPFRETPSLIAATFITEKEIAKSTLTETSLFLYKFATEPIPTTTEAEWIIQITTPIGPVSTSSITTRKSRTTTSIEKIDSVTESTFTIANITPIAITGESTVTLGEGVTLRRLTTSNVTYVITSEMEIEKMTLLATGTSVTRIPTSTITRMLKETSTVEHTETTPTKSTSTEITLKESGTATETKATTITPTKKISTNVTIALATQLPITQVIEGTTKVLMPTVVSEITTARLTTATIISSSTEGMEITLSTLTETVTTADYLREEESPVTQIEKSITAEETTTTESSPITIETLITTEISKISETAIAIESTTITEVPIATLIPTSIETREITEISVSTEILTSTRTTGTSETPSITETSTITETTSTTESIKTTENLTITEISTTAEISKIAETTIETSPTTVIPTSTIQTGMITEIITENLTTVEIPTLTETLTTAEITTTSELPIIIETSRVTEISTAIETIKTTENLTTIEISTTAEILSIIETTVETPITNITSTSTETVQTITEIITESPTTAEISTITESSTTLKITTTSEVPTVTETSTTTEVAKTTENLTTTEISTTVETLEVTETSTTIETPETTVTPTSTEIRTIAKISTTTETPTILTTNVTTLSTTESTSLSVTTEEFSSTSIEATRTISLLISTTLNETVSATISTIQLPEVTEVTTSSIIFPTNYSLITPSILPITKASSIEITNRTTFITVSSTETSESTLTFSTTPVTFSIETIPTTLSTLTAIKRPVTSIETTIPTTSLQLLETTLTNATLTETRYTTISTTPSKEIERTTETTKASLMTTAALRLTTERPEREKILEVIVTVTLTPFTESFSPPLITSEISATIPEITSALPKIALKTEDFEITSTIETPLISYTTESSTTLLTETTVYFATSITIATTEETLEVETEYYAGTEPQYEEKYEEYEGEYDTEIPIDKWYDYEDYEITKKKGTIVTVKYTKLDTEETTSPSFEETTSPYKTKTSEFTALSVVSDTSTSRTDTVTTAIILRTPSMYTEESTSASTFETSASTTPEVEIVSTASEEEETATTVSIFGSTEEYTLPSTTVLEITTKPLPLEYPTVSSMRDLKPTLESTMREITLPEFITKPKEVLGRETEKIPAFEKTDTTSEKDLTETKVSVEKLTSLFVSSVLSTLSEEEAIKPYITTSTEFPEETELTTVVGYEATTKPMKTPLITKEVETELEFTATSKSEKEVDREEQKKQLLQRLDELKRHEEEMAEREENLKKKERQWDREKQKRKKTMLHEKEKEEKIATTVNASTIYITTAVTDFTDTTFIVASSPSLRVITLTSIETTPFYTTEKSVFVKYTTKRTEEITTFSIIEETISTTYTTEKIKEMYTTSYETSFTSPAIVFTSLVIPDIDEFTTLPATMFDIHELIGVTPMTIATYTTEEQYITSYTTGYGEFTFSPPILTFTSSITLALDEFITLPITTSSDIFGEISVTFVTTPASYITEETYIATYEDIYSESVSPISVFASIAISTTSTSIIDAVVEIEYDEEIENLKRELYKKERELEKREKILREREENLEKDIAEFEKYMKEIEREMIDTSIALSEETTAPMNLSTPVPPTEKTTIKAQVTKQTRKTTKKKENQTTTEILTSRYETTKLKDIEEKERTRYIPEETVTQEKEEKIVTKRICLNVLENTTIPSEKRRKDVITKKICLPYFPEKNEEKKSVGRLSRKLLTCRNAREIRKSKTNLITDLRYRRKPKMIATTLKISNLQLSHHEWLNNETTQSLRHFKGFTRIYERTTQISKTVATICNTRKNIINYSPNRSSSYGERMNLHYENFFQPVTEAMLNTKKYRKRRISFEDNSVSEGVNNLFNNDKVNDEKRNISPIQKSTRYCSAKDVTVTTSREVAIANRSIDKKKKLNENENVSYTVNVLHLAYNKNEGTHEIVSIKPDEDELTFGSNDKREYDGGRDDYDYVNEKTDKIAKSYYELEEKDDLKKEDNEPLERIEDEAEDDDYAENMTENYITHYKKHDISTHERVLPKTELLDQSWPTEKNTMYHLGGTRYWEFESQVTESSITFNTTDNGRTIELSAIKTTCLDVVLTTERNDAKIRHNPHRRKRKTYFTMARIKHDKYNTLIEEQDTILKNLTRKNLPHSGIKIKWPSMAIARRATLEKSIDDSQKLHELDYYMNNAKGERITKLYAFPYNGNEIMIKDRKLCSINENKSKHQIVKHKNIEDIKDKNKNKRLIKSEKLHNVNSYSLKTCTDSCIIHKKNSDKHNKKIITETNVNFHSQAKDNNMKVTHHHIIADHKNKSISVLHKGKMHHCSNCICDIVYAINDIKSILNRINYPLDEIKALNCSKYKEIEDKIVISINSDTEEAKVFPQPRYNPELLKGQKYMKLEELEDDSKNYLELENDRDIVSLPGFNLNVPCNQEGSDITWLSSISRPSYTWRRMDGITLFGFVAENGDLELRNINAKDTGNYTCIMIYTNPDNEEPVETTYDVHLQVVTLPRYILHGENRYHIRSCDDRDLDLLITYFPLKLNNVICEANICNAYVLTPSCSRNEITINILIVPSRIIKLMTVDHKHCNVFCLKAIQDKLSLILSRNLQIFLGRTIIFRLPHVEQRLVPIREKSSFTRSKRGKTGANTSGGRFGSVGLFSSCPAGYGLHGSQCLPCDVGTYSEDGISHCKICPPGTYQPNHGARVCRTCTNPLTKGCYNMLWNSFSAVIVTLASVSVALTFFLLMLWIICCAKKKFCMKQIASIISQEDVFKQEKHVEEQPLIKDTSENEDPQWDNEHIVKKKKGKFYINKRRRKQNEKKRYEKTQIRNDEWGSHDIKEAPIICLESYRSHENYNNYYPKQSYRKGPRLPECDFDT